MCPCDTSVGGAGVIVSHSVANVGSPTALTAGELAFAGAFVCRYGFGTIGLSERQSQYSSNTNDGVGVEARTPIKRKGDEKEGG